MLSHLLLTPLKKQRMPPTTFTPGFKSGLRYEQFCIAVSSLSTILGAVGGGGWKRSPYLVSVGPSKHKNHLTLLHKLLLASASWIPCPAALRTLGGIKQSTDHLLGSHSPSREQSVLIRMLHLQTPPAQWQQDLPVKRGQDKWCIALIPNSVAQTETRWRRGSLHLL